MEHINKKIKVENDMCANDYSYENTSRSDKQNHIFENNHSHSSNSVRYNEEHIPLENFLIVNENLILNNRKNEHNHDDDIVLIEDLSPKNNSFNNENKVTNNSPLPELESCKDNFHLENTGSQDCQISQRQSITECVNYANISEKEKKSYSTHSIADIFFKMEQNLCQELLKINYYTGGSKIMHVYNPIDYAEEIHRDFLNKFCHRGQKVLLLGMNPGPWGMGQTGVPFGHVDYAREWLQVRGEVRKPLREHPKRPVIGLSSSRKEVSGDRLWSLLKEMSGTPEALFKQVYLHNYCPLFFMKETGKNVTPPELKVETRRVLETICDRGLAETLTLMGTQHIVAVGNYSTTRAQRTIKEYNMTNITVSTLMHPSPINPAANKGWRDIALKQLVQANVLQYFIHTKCDDGVL